MQLPLVTIITPSYNQAAFLEDTIQSVLRQDYPNLEYLIVDGGSSDGSREIIRKYADRLAWWVSEPDQGQAQAINKGMQRAGGEIIAWLNSDDLYLPGCVGRAVTVLQANPQLVMVFGDAITIDRNGRLLNLLSFGDWGLEELMCFRIICQPAVFMRREPLVRAGYLDESYHLMLDHHLWLRIAMQGPIQHVSQIWAMARQHQQAKNVALAGGFAEEIERILVWMESEAMLATRFAQRRRQIRGGAYRLQGRYLLDGGVANAALAAYFRSLCYWPGYALHHWPRMAFAMFSLISPPLATQLAGWSRRQRVERCRHRAQHALRQQIPDPEGLIGWPGIKVEEP